MSNSLRPYGLQHTKLPCPSPTPGACSNSCSLSQWCHPTISSSVIPFSSCPQSFPTSGFFPMSQFFASGGQNIGVSASASVLPMKSRFSPSNDWSGIQNLYNGVNYTYINGLLWSYVEHGKKLPQCLALCRPGGKEGICAPFFFYFYFHLLRIKSQIFAVYLGEYWR